MRTRLIAAALTILSVVPAVKADLIQIKGKTYQSDVLIDRQIAPGVRYLRLRLPDYPLNVNMVIADMNDPYNRIETTVANESAKGTEKLVTAANRLTSKDHRPVAAANANFWIVASQKEYPLYSGITRNANVRNGKMVTECNKNKEKWDGGAERTGVVCVSYDKKVFVDYCVPYLTFRKAPSGTVKNIQTCNKGYRTGVYGMYNSFYGRDREFMPYYEGTDAAGAKKFILDESVTDGIEVYLTMDAGQEWTGGNDIKFTVKEVKKNTNGRGKLGNYDLAIVSFGGASQTLAVDDPVILKYYWTFNQMTPAETPIVEQAIGGNALVMRNHELTDHNYNEDYNSTVYSRTGYGCSEDGKTLFMIVIDKSTDPVYGKSAGCGTDVMCEIANHYGCANMSNFDAGGSAEMMIDYQIVNKTTESTPRAVANGWMLFDISPDDNKTLDYMEFDHPEIDVPVGGSFTPVVLGYNEYGSLIDKDVKDFVLECDANLGRCEGSKFIAGNVAATGTLTAKKGNIEVYKTITVGGGSGIKEIAAGFDSRIAMPSVAMCGSDIQIVSKGVEIDKVSVVNIAGAKMADRSVKGCDAALKAPEQCGVYVVIIACSDGTVTSRKLIITN